MPAYAGIKILDSGPKGIPSGLSPACRRHGRNDDASVEVLNPIENKPVREGSARLAFTPFELTEWYPEDTGLFEIDHFPVSHNVRAEDISICNEEPLTTRCSNCRQTVLDFSETTRRYVCPMCAASVDAQVIVERKQRGMTYNRGWTFTL